MIPEFRKGQPSPLLLHLGAAMSGYVAALSVAQKTTSAEFPWHPELTQRAENLPAQLDHVQLATSTLHRLKSFESGLRKWQNHPFQRPECKRPAIWKSGSSRLLDFGGGSSGKTILVIPSLINRSHILDLMEGLSILQYLANNGLRPLLLDWGTPSDAERRFDLNAYATKRILPAIDVARSTSNRDIGVLGYCMGGTLAAGVVAHKGNGIGAFATIGSPWDFEANSGIAAALRMMAKTANAEQFLDDIGQVFGVIPADVFQTLFAMINPMQACVKFQRFDQFSTASPEAHKFVAIEDWLADGVPMTTGAAQDLLVNWNTNNATASGDWMLFDQPVVLEKFTKPALITCGKRDSIVPMTVSTPLATALPNSRILSPDAGHIGMIIGKTAPTDVWVPISRFFHEHL